MVLLLYSLKVNVRLMKRFLLVLLGVVNCCGLWRSRASLAFGELQYQFWNESAGMWRSSMWWQAANTVEVIVNLGLASAGEKDVVLVQLNRGEATVYNFENLKKKLVGQEITVNLNSGLTDKLNDGGF